LLLEKLQLIFPTKGLARLTKFRDHKAEIEIQIDLLLTLKVIIFTNS
jgi:hypothetical protein